MNIEKQLKDKTAKERANLKSKELAKVKIDKFTKKGINIEIIGDIEEIDDGIQLFAKAWKDGKQLGFGEDGTVEIERFRFYNPPVLVDDDNGEIIREWKEENEDTKEIITKYRKLKYDPNEVIKQILEQTIKLVGKENTKIIIGKIGHTTSTFYPEAGTGTYTCDGTIHAGSATGGWNQTHDATDSSSLGVNVVSTDLVKRYFAGSDRRADGFIRMTRSAFIYKTGAIDAGDVISSAILSVYGDSTNFGDTSGITEMAVIQLANGWTADNNINSADWNQFGDKVDDPTEGAPRIDLAVNWTQSDYNNFTLNATGKGWVAKSGETKPTGANNSGITYLGGRNNFDVEDVDPYDNASTNNRAYVYYADEDGTTKDPKLVVEHEEEPQTGGNFFQLF